MKYRTPFYQKVIDNVRRGPYSDTEWAQSICKECEEAMKKMLH